MFGIANVSKSQPVHQSCFEAHHSPALSAELPCIPESKLILNQNFEAIGAQETNPRGQWNASYECLKLQLDQIHHSKSPWSLAIKATPLAVPMADVFEEYACHEFRAWWRVCDWFVNNFCLHRLGLVETSKWRKQCWHKVYQERLQIQGHDLLLGPCSSLPTKRVCLRLMIGVEWKQVVATKTHGATWL